MKTRNILTQEKSILVPIFFHSRYNSSIEGQKKKNQRKKSKKRTQERRKSESEAEDDIMVSTKVGYSFNSYFCINDEIFTQV